MSDDEFRSVHIAFKLSPDANRLLSISAKKSGRKKLQEAKIRLESHLSYYDCIADHEVSICRVCIEKK